MSKRQLILKSLVSKAAETRLTRRHFVQLTASIPLTAACITVAHGRTIKEDAKLDFLLSDNRETLKVSLRPLKSNSSSPEFPNDDYPDWILSRAAFGPDASFHIGHLQKRSRSTVVLEIKDASMGERRNHSVQIIFRKQANINGGRWGFNLSTTLWPSSTNDAGYDFESKQFGSKDKLHTIDLRSFLSDKSNRDYPIAYLGVGKADHALKTATDNRLRVVRARETFETPEKGERSTTAITIEFRKDLSWKVRPDPRENFAIAAFSGSVIFNAKGLNAAWQIPVLDVEAQPSDTESSFHLFSGKAVTTGGSNFFDFIAKGGERAIIAPRTRNDIGVSVILGAKEDKNDSDRFASASFLTMEEAEITSEAVAPNKHGLGADGNSLVLEQLTISETKYVPVKDGDQEPIASLRTVVTGNVLRNKEASKPKIQEISTPVGRLTIRGRKRTKQAQKDAATDIDELLLSALGDRQFNPVDDVWLVADANLQSSKTRLLQKLDIQLALLRCDTALPDAQFSTLIFGDVKRFKPKIKMDSETGNDDGYTNVNGTDLTVCIDRSSVDENARGPANTSYLALFGQTGVRKDGNAQSGDKPVARFDLTRAHLAVADGNSMIDLGFEFADLFLEFHPAPAIVPATAECRVIVNTDGERIDNRPILIVHMKPQHLMEEAVEKPLLNINDADLAARISAMNSSINNLMSASSSKPKTSDLARALEQMSASSDIFYGFLRDFYGQSLSKFNARSDCRGTLPSEYFHALNRQHLAPDERNALDAIQETIQSKFANWMKSNAEYPKHTRARSSRGSRLAFHLNCGPTSEETDVLNSIPFTLADLTRFERHEPSVSPRAKAFLEPLEDGRIPLAASGSAILDSKNILELNGIKPNARNALTRMDDVRSALSQPPSGLETSIEIPARIHLSTSERGIWIANWEAPDGVLEKADSDLPDAALKKDLAINEIGVVETQRHRLWSTRLVTDLSTPDVRVVWTPDYRAESLRPWPKGPRNPHYAPPPYGPEAPWFSSRPHSAEGGNDADQCKPTAAKRFADWMASTVTPTGRRALLEQEKEFRTALSANDRHQLYLLTSARGLPTIGKREFDGDNLLGGAIIEGSNQFEPGEDFSLPDLNDDQAIYDPQPLNIRELSLSALGGSLAHTTAFNPPLPARLKDQSALVPAHLRGRPVYDGLSVQLYQHRIVMGRIVDARVSYKGYLFPLGHRASLVKLTERVIVWTKGHGVKAYPVQRQFITVSEPDKRYPAVGQPNRGRRFGVGTVSVNSDSTIDITDPTVFQPGDSGDGGVQTNGRIRLGPVGLMFWPHNRETRKILKFEIEIDGARTTAPLIFVDNTAIGDPDILNKLSTYFNSLRAEEDERNWSTNGAKITFADQRKPGDTKLATNSLTIGVEGLFAENTLERWEGTNTAFVSYGALEGAEQPPFYPVIEKTNIKLDSLAEFSSLEVPSVDASYDGHFVKYGFALADSKRNADKARENDNVRAKENGLEIFLNFPTIEFEMEENGDRSGGVARPSNPVIGVSRSNGLVSHINPGAYRHLTDDCAVPSNNADNEPATVKARKSLASAVTALDPLLSIVPIFDCSPQVSLDQRGKLLLRQQRFLTQYASSEIAFDEITGNVESDKVVQKQAQLNFDKDAKILGCLTFEQLFELLELAGLDLSEVLPKLLEAVSYGLEILNQVEDAVDDVLEAVRSYVLRPTSAVIERIENSWNELNQRINDYQSELAEQAGEEAKANFQPLLLSTLFPEVGTGLVAMRVALDAATAQSDPLKMPDELAGVYEAGDGLVKGLSAIATDPVERLEQGLKDVFDQNIGILERKIKETISIDGIEETVNLLTDEKELKKQILDFAIDQAIIAMPPGLFSRLALVPVQNLAELREVEFYIGNLVGEKKRRAQEKIARIQNALGKIFPDISAIEEVLPIVFELISSGKPQDITSAYEEFERALNKLEGFKKQSLKAAKEAKTIADGLNFEEIDSAQAASTKAALVASIDLYVKALTALKIEGTQLENRIKHIVSSAVAELQRIVNIIKSAKLAGEAINDGDVKQFIAASQALSVYIFGTDYTAQPGLQSFIKSVTDVSKKVEKVLESPFTELLNLEGVAGVSVKGTDQAICGIEGDARIAALVKNTGSPSFMSEVLGPVSDAVKALEKAVVDTGALATKVNGSTDIPVREKTKFFELFGDPSVQDDMVGDNRVQQVMPFLRVQRMRLADLYCIQIEAAQLLNEAISDASNNSFKSSGIDNIIKSLAKAQKKLLQDAGDVVSALVEDTAKFAENNKELLLAGGLSSALQEQTKLKEWIKGDGKVLFQKAEAQLINAQDNFAKAVLKTLNKTIVVLNNVSSYLAPLSKLPIDTVAPVLRLLPDIILSDQDVDKFVAAMNAIVKQLSEDVKISPFSVVAPEAKWTFKTILQAENEQKQKLETVLENPKSLIEGPAATLEAGREEIVSLVELLSTRGEGLEGKALEKLDPFVRELLVGNKLRPAKVEDVNSGLVGGYSRVIESRNDLIKQIGSRASWLESTAERVLKPVTQDGKGILEQEKVTLFDISAAPLSDKEQQRNLRKYLRKWDTGDAAPLLILEGVRDLVGQVAKGDIFALIDVSVLRDELEDQLATLIPLKRKVGYDFKHTFGSTGMKDALFYPLPGGHFDLSFKAEIDLLDIKSLTYEANGSMGPFRVNLLHQFGIEAIILNFGGATFRMASGEKFNFDVDFQDYEIGPALEFVAELQAYMGVSGSGLFVDQLKDKPGVLAGYGLDLGIISLGALSFSNVSLAISAELPFDKSTALFRASLSRRMAPFMISALPWAGSGFFGVIATANSIVGFEASMEFGVGGGFQIGPLVGYGRVQAGFYIKTIKLEIEGKSQRVTEISGTFYAGGSASLWIFNISASLYVRLGMLSDGSMSGEAIFSFSFKIGFARFRFSVRAAYGQDKLAEGEQSASRGSEGDGGSDNGHYEILPPVRKAKSEKPIQFAALGDANVVTDVPSEVFAFVPSRKITAGQATSSVKGMNENWKKYRSYFDEGLL